MGLFSRNTSYENSGLLAGLTDWHTHILPGVDDGVGTMSEALDILQLYESAGVRNVWLTPHIMEDIPNETEALRARFAELKSAYRGNIKLHLAAEYMLDSLFEDRLRAGDLLPLGTGARHILVETSYYSAPAGFFSTLTRIKSKGYFPVLAHPERYRYMSDADFSRCLEMGVVMQINMFSAIGMYGDTARKRVGSLLKMKKPAQALGIELPECDGCPAYGSASAISLIGSDVHSLRQASHLSKKELHTSVADAIAKAIART